MSALKMRRNKKNATAAQALGKTTGRWTEEEHQRFNEGKFGEFKSLPALQIACQNESGCINYRPVWNRIQIGLLM